MTSYVLSRVTSVNPSTLFRWNTQTEFGSMKTQKERQELFSPFDSDGNLWIQDNKITRDPDSERDYIEYHVDQIREDIYRVEYSTKEELLTQIYEGRIPNRQFFLDLLDNCEYPLPERDDEKLKIIQTTPGDTWNCTIVSPDGYGLTLKFEEDSRFVEYLQVLVDCSKEPEGLRTHVNYTIEQVRKEQDA